MAIPTTTRTAIEISFSGCFKCGRQDHVVKNCHLLKEKQGSEQVRTRGKKTQLTNAEKWFTKPMMAAWGDTLEEKEDSQDGEEAVALMARRESDSDSDSIESLSQLKEEVRNPSMRTLEKLVFTLMEECEIVNSKNCMLKNTC